MRLFVVVLFVALGFGCSCATTPRVFHETGYPLSGTDTVDSGTLVYYDRNAGYLPDPGNEPTQALECRITRQDSALGKLFGDPSRKLVQASTLTGFGAPVTFAWVCEYKVRPTWSYDYQFRVDRAPPGITIVAFETTGPGLRSALPFEVVRGTVQGTPIRVVGIRDIAWYRTRQATFGEDPISITWWSLQDPYQKFQVVTDDNLVLGEVEGQGGRYQGTFRYRVLDTTPPASVESVKALLAMMASLGHFLSEAEEYRNGWSPDAGRASPSATKDWPTS